MRSLLFESITVDELSLPIATEKNIRLAVLRLDRIHPVISGNKWFKLKYHIENARAKGKNHIATFGGAYSNHIVATAAAGNLYNIKTTGIIRGERPQKLSQALLHAMEFGMELFFRNRADYRSKRLPSEIEKQRDVLYLINEGGYGPEGAKGAQEILHHCKKEDYSHISCAVGTSTMMAGLVKASLPHQKIIGISVLKNNIHLKKDLEALLLPEEQKKNFHITHDYHFGGYAKKTAELTSFMNDFFEHTSIPTDFVYTGKLFFGILDIIKDNSIPQGSNVLLIHSGGLQGNLSLPEGTLIF